MVRWILVVLLVLAANAFAPAQDEATLKSFFEGHKVVVELDMPATCDGIDLDVFPTGNSQINYGSYSKRLKQFGIAFETRDKSAMYAATGIVLLYAVHLAINMGMTLGLLPVIGIAGALVLLWLVLKR